MPSGDFSSEESPLPADEPSIDCEACQTAVESEGGQDVAFLFLDHLTIPVLSCDDHLETFASLCGLTTDDTPDIVRHHPAGGIRCPGCRNARYDISQLMLPVHDGALVVLACPEHQAAITQRFQSGLETRSQLTSDLDATMDSLL